MVLSEDEIKAREHNLMSYASDLIKSLRESGHKNAMLSEELIELIKRISSSDIILEDPTQFESVKKQIEDCLKSSNNNT